MSEIIKKCGCGREYSFAEWQKLPISHIICSKQYHDYVKGEPDTEFRHCVCGSTIGIEIKCIHGEKKE